MSDVVVSLDLVDQSDEAALNAAIDAYAQWRSDCESEADSDAPDIMVRTSWQSEGVRKTLIFQDRSWAAQFLTYWRQARRLST